jgi:pSer/pThr/pTyr-binding forkhead associated (FHA) protein
MAEKSNWILHRLSFCDKDTKIVLSEGSNSVGRSEFATDIRLLSKFTSRKHCEFIVNGDEVKVKDFNVSDAF